MTQCVERSFDSQQPNVIILLSDDQGWGDFSLHGNRNLETPNIDQLAREGARFENFYVAPVCSPTRAEMLTGRYHFRGGISGTSAGAERLDLDERTLADIFRQAGYATAAYGKWHNGMQSPYHPNSRGFDDFYGFCSGHWGEYFDPMLEHNGALVKGNGYVTNDFTDHGLTFIEQHKHQPFLLYLPFNTPHRPMQVPDRWWNKFQEKEILMRSAVEDEDLDYTRAALAMCENIDWNVGRILDKLRELDIEENTIVLYFNDNGPNAWRWNDGMKGKKGSTDEGGVRSPLFIKWPLKIKGEKRIKHVSAAIDLLPTLCELAGVAPSSDKPLDGKSLAPLLFGEQPTWSDRYIFNQWNGNISVRNQTYRMDAAGRLYNIEKDRGQVTDLSRKMPEIKRAFDEALQLYTEEVKRELPGEDLRPFPIGDPAVKYTQLPARDAKSQGYIERSSQFPNCSYFTNWTSLQDQITWNVEVLQPGMFEVTLYYTCPTVDTGSIVELSLGESRLRSRIDIAHDPSLQGMEHDRVPRGNSYVKDWKSMVLGKFKLEEGPGQLVFRALEVPGGSVMDFRLLMFERI
ncbi:MAG: arylsulfatase [Saprospiraceae bacterium]|nr:arylsulfatase [Saprospiraceae bacterium]